MPLYMDVRSIDGGVTAADVAGAHAKDVEVQARHGVDYKHYRVDEKAGKTFCLVDALVLSPRPPFTAQNGAFARATLGHLPFKSRPKAD
jgi:hypothetical protein